jgi:membrane-associated phospholipid phosphatase
MSSLRARLAACVLAGVVVHAVAYGIAPLERADVRALGHAPFSPHWLNRLVEDLLWWFDPVPFALLVLLVAGTAWAAGRPRGALGAAVLMIGSGITTQVLKTVLAMPHDGASRLPDDAFPSGHTTAAASLALALALLVPAGRRAPVLVAGALLTAVVGVSLVVLGRHYPSDVLGGLCVAGAWAAVAAAISHREARAAAR